MEQSLSCEGNLTEKETYNSLISLENNKSPGNDGLTKEFYWTFWVDIKDTFMKSLKESDRLKVTATLQKADTSLQGIQNVNITSNIFDVLIT